MKTPQLNEGVAGSTPLGIKPRLGYVAFYNRQKWEGFADSLYAAKLLAIAHFKAPKSKAHLVAIALAEKDGQPIIHTATE